MSETAALVEVPKPRILLNRPDTRETFERLGLTMAQYNELMSSFDRLARELATDVRASNDPHLIMMASAIVRRGQDRLANLQSLEIPKIEIDQDLEVEVGRLTAMLDIIKNFALTPDDAAKAAPQLRPPTAEELYAFATAAYVHVRDLRIPVDEKNFSEAGRAIVLNSARAKRNPLPHTAPYSIQNLAEEHGFAPLIISKQRPTDRYPTSMLPPPLPTGVDEQLPKLTVYNDI